MLMSQNKMGVFDKNKLANFELPLVGNVAGLTGVFWFHIEPNLYFMWFHQQWVCQGLKTSGMEL